MDNMTYMEKQAIDAAISGRWDEAVSINEQIVKKDKKNTDAFLRLGFACIQDGNLKKARINYKKALLLQPGNRTATENLEKLKILETKKIRKIKDVNLNPYLFLDIPGKTKTVTLVNCGQKTDLARLGIGQKLALIVKKRRVEVRTLDEEEYIGCLPDDISKRLTIFIKAGSSFDCFVKDTNLKHSVVFLREEKKGKKVSKYASFPVNIQSNLQNIASGSEDGGEADEPGTDMDLEQLADSITEEKEYLGYEPEDKDDDPEE